MKNKPQVHFWRETVCAHDAEFGTAIIAIHCCRAWDDPANGVFMLFFGSEIASWSGRERCRALVLEKLERRETALMNWYGRGYRKHLDQFELTPRERQDAARRRAAQHESGNAGADF